MVLRRQRKEAEALVLEAIHNAWSSGFPPTYREVAGVTGMSVSNVHRYVGYLVQDGLVYDRPNVTRSLRLTDAGHARLLGEPGDQPSSA